MDLSTIDRVKTALGLTSDVHDVFLAALVRAVSATAEKYMSRHAEQKDRTEYFRVSRNQKVFQLKGYPVDTAQTFEVRSDSEREYGATTVLDASTYAIDDEIGVLEVDDVTLEEGPRALRVQYTGGMATDTEAFVVAFPDVALAVEMQAKWLFKRRDDDGLTAVSAEGGSITAFPDLKLLPETRRILETHKLYSVGSM